MTKMRIQDIVKLKGEMLAYCVGDDLPIDFDCKRIAIEDKVFNVLRVGTSVAFCGKINALMKLDVRNEEDIPRGEFIVLQ